MHKKHFEDVAARTSPQEIRGSARKGFCRVLGFESERLEVTRVDW